MLFKRISFPNSFTTLGPTPKWEITVDTSVIDITNAYVPSNPTPNLDRHAVTSRVKAAPSALTFSTLNALRSKFDSPDLYIVLFNFSRLFLVNQY